VSSGFKALIALVAVAALGAVASAIWVGTRTFEGTVVSNPYDAATHFDEARHHAAGLGWQCHFGPAEYRAGTQTLRFSLSARDGAPIEGASAVVRVSRPGTVRQDAAVTARSEGGGRFAADVHFPEPGLWDLEVRASRGPEALAFDRRVQVER